MTRDIASPPATHLHPHDELTRAIAHLREAGFEFEVLQVSEPQAIQTVRADRDEPVAA